MGYLPGFSAPEASIFAIHIAFRHNTQYNNLNELFFIFKEATNTLYLTLFYLAMDILVGRLPNVKVKKLNLHFLHF